MAVGLILTTPVPFAANSIFAFDDEMMSLDPTSKSPPSDGVESSLRFSKYVVSSLANDAGDTARVVLVPVAVSALVAILTIPAAVCDAVLFVRMRSAVSPKSVEFTGIVGLFDRSLYDPLVATVASDDVAV